MKKIVINSDYGGFSLSEEAIKELGLPYDGYGFDYTDKRSDKKLVDVVEKLGERANGVCASLKVIKIPDGVDWEIEEYDGKEWVSEKHKVWG